jgi:hypothetical protein
MWSIVIFLLISILEMPNDYEIFVLLFPASTLELFYRPLQPVKPVLHAAARAGEVHPQKLCAVAAVHSTL